MYGNGGNTNSRRPMARVLDRPNGDGLSTRRSRRKSSARHGGPRPDDPARSAHRFVGDPPRLAETIELPSGLQKALETLAEFLVAEVVAAIQCGIAALHSLNKAGFFFQISCQRVLHDFIRLPTLAGGGVRQLRL